jgi:hypothetical protein
LQLTHLNPNRWTCLFTHGLAHLQYVLAYVFSLGVQVLLPIVTLNLLSRDGKMAPRWPPIFSHISYFDQRQHNLIEDGKWLQPALPNLPQAFPSQWGDEAGLAHLLCSPPHTIPLFCITLLLVSHVNTPNIYIYIYIYLLSHEWCSSLSSKISNQNPHIAARVAKRSYFLFQLWKILYTIMVKNLSCNFL